jgi:MinD-like ATPase involved in chromosome partitioning or flagellar assembly
MDSISTNPYLKTLLIAPADRQVPFHAVLHLGSSLPVRISNSLPSFKMDGIEEILKESTIHIVLVDGGTPGYTGDEFISLRQKSPRPVALIGLAAAGTPEMEQMLGLGLDGVYASPPTEASIRSMLGDIPAKYESICAMWGGTPWDVAPATIRAALEQATKVSWQRAVVSFWSPKGGEGKTTLATETGAVLAVTTQRNVCIVDGNMLHGHQRYNLSAGTLNQSIIAVAQQAALIRDDARRDAEFGLILDRHLAPVGSLPNLKLLPGVLNPSNATQPEVVGARGEAFAEELLRQLRAKFDFVLIDLGSALDKALHRAFLRNSDYVMVIGGPSRNSLIDIATDVNSTVADKLVSRDRFRLILNKWEDCGIKLDKVTETIGLPIAARVRPAPAKMILSQQNLGKSFVAEFHRGKQSREIEDLLRDFADVAGLLYPGVSELWAARAKKK